MAVQYIFENMMELRFLGAKEDDDLTLMSGLMSKMKAVLLFPALFGMKSHLVQIFDISIRALCVKKKKKNLFFCFYFEYCQLRDF